MSFVGVHVYQWSAVSRAQTARLDVSKLAPCSESLHSIAIDDAPAQDSCTVRTKQKYLLTQPSH